MSPKLPEATDWAGARAAYRYNRATEHTESVFITTACEGFCIMEHTIFKLFSGLQRNTFNMKPQSFRVILKCLCVLGVKM